MRDWAKIRHGHEKKKVNRHREADITLSWAHALWEEEEDSICLSPVFISQFLSCSRCLPSLYHESIVPGICLKLKTFLMTWFHYVIIQSSFFLLSVSALKEVEHSPSFVEIKCNESLFQLEPRLLPLLFHCLVKFDSETKRLCTSTWLIIVSHMNRQRIKTLSSFSYSAWQPVSRQSKLLCFTGRSQLFSLLEVRMNFRDLFSFNVLILWRKTFFRQKLFLPSPSFSTFVHFSPSLTRTSEVMEMRVKVQVELMQRGNKEGWGRKC